MSFKHASHSNAFLVKLTVIAGISIAASSTAFAAGLGGIGGGLGEAVGGVVSGVGSAVDGVADGVDGVAGSVNASVNANAGAVNASVNVGSANAGRSTTQDPSVKEALVSIDVGVLAQKGLTPAQREALASVGINISGIVDLAIEIGANRPTRTKVVDALNSLSNRSRKAVIVQCRQLVGAGGMFNNKMKGVCSKALSAA